jgi:hypothetical protein
MALRLRAPLAMTSLLSIATNLFQMEQICCNAEVQV